MCKSKNIKQGLENPYSFETKTELAAAQRRFYNKRLTKELGLKGGKK
jgi:hypothetical protein